MNSFVILLIGAAVWGVTLGGAFIGGIVVGKGQSEVSPAANISAAPGLSSPASVNGESNQSNVVPGQGAQLDQSQMQELRQRIQSGEMTQEEIDALREQMRQGAGPGQFRQGQGGQFGGPGGQQNTPGQQGQSQPSK